MIKKKSAGGGTRDQQTIKKKYIYQHGGKRLGRSFEREKGDSRRRGRGMEVVSAAEEKEEGGHRKKEEKEGLRREGGEKKKRKHGEVTQIVLPLPTCLFGLIAFGSSWLLVP